MKRVNHLNLRNNVYLTYVEMSRGFGFVTFSTQESRDKVLLADSHFIGESKIDCKAAMTKEEAFHK